MAETEEERVRKLPLFSWRGNAEIDAPPSELPGGFDPRDEQPTPFWRIYPTDGRGVNARGRIHEDEV
jgi:hypothetical protein